MKAIYSFYVNQKVVFNAVVGAVLPRIPCSNLQGTNSTTNFRKAEDLEEKAEKTMEKRRLSNDAVAKYFFSMHLSELEISL